MRVAMLALGSMLLTGCGGGGGSGDAGGGDGDGGGVPADAVGVAVVHQAVKISGQAATPPMPASDLAHSTSPQSAQSTSKSNEKCDSGSPKTCGN